MNTIQKVMIEKDAKEIARIIHEECFIDTSHSEKPYFVWDIDVATNVIQFALDAYAKAKLEEAADKAIKWVLSFGVVGSQEMPDLRAAILGKEGGMIIQFPNRKILEGEICGTCLNFDDYFEESNEILGIDDPEHYMRERAQKIPACPGWKSIPERKGEKG